MLAAEFSNSFSDDIPFGVEHGNYLLHFAGSKPSDADLQQIYSNLPKLDQSPLPALVNYLRSRQVTTYLTLDIPTIAGPTLEFAETPLSLIAENLVLLRTVEYRGKLHPVLSVLTPAPRPVNEARTKRATSAGLNGACRASRSTLSRLAVSDAVPNAP